MNFRITWPSGKVTVEASSVESKDQYAMERWGQHSADEVAKLFGVKLEETADGQVNDTQASVNLKTKRVMEAKAAVVAS